MTDNNTTNPPQMASAPDPDETMQQAVERFRTRMTGANRQFIQDCIHEIEARGLATETEKLQRMSHTDTS